MVGAGASQRVRRYGGPLREIPVQAAFRRLWSPPVCNPHGASLYKERTWIRGPASIPLLASVDILWIWNAVAAGRTTNSNDVALPTQFTIIAMIALGTSDARA